MHLTIKRRISIVNDAVKKGTGTADDATRRAIYEGVVKRIAEQAYWVPLFTMPINYVFANDLEIPIPKDENVEFWRGKWK